MENYDLIVIGTGPAGEKAAVKAAYFNHRVAIIEMADVFGGAGVVTGTLPSKTLKETALYFSGKLEQGLYGIERNLQHAATIEDFMFRKNYITAWAAKEVHDNLIRHGVDIYSGVASFKDSHVIQIHGEKEQFIRGDYILIATGSYPHHPTGIPFDGKRVHDSDTILQITHFPRSLCIVGAGVIGCEYATIFSTMGTHVYLVNDKASILSHVDAEVSRELVAQMEGNGIKILFNHAIVSVDVPKTDSEPLSIQLSSGQKIETDLFLYAAGRSGQTKALQCDKIGLKVGKRETLEVDAQYRTNIPHIFAAGDVVGFPALASTSMEQGRVAVSHMFGTKDLVHLPIHVPYGIYTIPEVSMVGMTEEDALQSGISFCAGKARYADMPRGKIMGAKHGFLKLIFRREDFVVIGVHVIGYIATEIIHLGASLVEEKRSLYHIIEQVFNYPTLHDLYKYAAYDGLSNSSGHKIKS